MLTQAERKQIADTILRQLGGRHFAAMTGAKNFIYGDEGELRFALPGRRGYVRNGWNAVEIRLTPSDTYTMTFFKYGKYEVKAKDVHEDLYWEDLRLAFERVTGLRTSLGTMGVSR